jgi:hypothetical protein
MRHRTAIAVLVLALLTACGGSGTPKGIKNPAQAGQAACSQQNAATVDFAGCTWNGNVWAPVTSTTTTDTTPVTTPDTSASALGVGTLCANATGALVQQILALGGTVQPAQYNGTSPFYRALVVSLNDCSSRIEWLTSIDSQVTGGTEAARDAIFHAGCGVERFTSQAMSKIPNAGDALNPPGTPVNHPDAYPIPVACQAQ